MKRIQSITATAITFSASAATAIAAGPLANIDSEQRAATARYYSAATVPPHLPVPANGALLSMTVRNVGTFNYDEGGFPDPLRVAANCQR